MKKKTLKRNIRKTEKKNSNKKNISFHKKRKIIKSKIVSKKERICQ